MVAGSVLATSIAASACAAPARKQTARQGRIAGDEHQRCDLPFVHPSPSRSSSSRSALTVELMHEQQVRSVSTPITIVFGASDPTISVSA